MNLPTIKESFESWDPELESKIDTECCPNCFNTDCLDTSELITCKECGYVVARPFDNTAEYRYFSQEDRGGDPTRVGAPQDPRLPEASLGTIILNGYGTAKTMYRILAMKNPVGSALNRSASTPKTIPTNEARRLEVILFLGLCSIVSIEFRF